jgi:hypothetical protein
MNALVLYGIPVSRRMRWTAADAMKISSALLLAVGRGELGTSRFQGSSL